MKALKENGVFYCSFKYGSMEVEKDGRYFNYINEESMSKLLNKNNINVMEIYKTNDVRTDRNNEIWINVIIQNRLGV